jgi:hypothetical protein
LYSRPFHRTVRSGKEVDYDYEYRPAGRTEHEHEHEHEKNADVPESLRFTGPMVKCEEGYLCSVCGGDVAELADSDLYLRFVAGMVDPEVLHTTPERHIRCNPVLAQFIVHPDFEPALVEGDFNKSLLDPAFRSGQESLLTRAWLRLRELRGQDLPIHEYPLPEVLERLAGQTGT